MVGVIISLIVIAFMVRFLLKRYKPQFVILTGGLVLLFSALAMHYLGVLDIGLQLLPKKATSTGWEGFDPFKCITAIMSSRVAGLGLIIMSAAGYSKYMSMIGASARMADLMSRPLRKLNSPYLVLAFSYVIGQFMNVFIPSAAGLGMLLMVTMYPVLIRLGVTNLSAASLVATTACLDLGPASGNANLAAKYAGLDSMSYFIDYQIPVSIAVVIVIATLHYFVQRHYDRVQGEAAWVTVDGTKPASELDFKDSPRFYWILPMLPLILLFIFSKFMITSIKLDVTTAMILSFAVALFLECIRHNVKKTFDDAMQFFDSMGHQFARVVSLIVAGELFAQGLIATGTVAYLIDALKSAGMSGVFIMIVLTAFIMLVSVLMGSGNAPFFAFSPLVPDFAREFGVNTILLILPMQFATSLGRTMSPIAGVIIAVSGVAGVSSFDVVKRTAIPMLGGMITTVIGVILLT